MGYYTYYKLKVHKDINQVNNDIDIFSDGNLPELELQITKDLYTIMYEDDWNKEVNAPSSLNSLISYDTMKWYGYNTDMIALSAKYPDYYFVLYGEGEESDDIWKTLYHKGKEIDTSIAYIRYPEFCIPEDIDE